MKALAFQAWCDSKDIFRVACLEFGRAMAVIVQRSSLAEAIERMVITCMAWGQSQCLFRLWWDGHEWTGRL